MAKHLWWTLTFEVHEFTTKPTGHFWKLSYQKYILFFRVYRISRCFYLSIEFILSIYKLSSAAPVLRSSASFTSKLTAQRRDAVTQFSAGVKLGNHGDGIDRRMLRVSSISRAFRDRLVSYTARQPF